MKQGANRSVPAGVIARRRANVVLISEEKMGPEHIERMILSVLSIRGERLFIG